MKNLIIKISIANILLLTWWNACAYDFIYDNLPYTVLSTVEYTCALERNVQPYEGHFIVPDTVQFLDYKFKVVQIGDGCFSNSPNLISVDLSSGATFTSPSMFENCSKLENVILSKSQVSIPERTFYGCSSLTSFDTGSNIRSIGKDAFSKCGNLEKFIIGEGVKTIDSDWFGKSCPKLKELYISDSSETLIIAAGLTDEMAESKYNGKTEAIYYTPLFYNLPIEKVYIGRSITDSMIRNTSNGIEYYYPFPFSYNKNIIEVEIGGKTQFIKSSRAGIANSRTDFGSFIGCSHMKNVNISSSAFTKIEEGMFRGCSMLSKISMPETIVSIDEDAFRDCKNIETIKIPNECTLIEDNAFRGCTSLVEINLNQKLKELGLWVFENTKLTSLNLPASLTTVSEYSFEGLSSLEEIIFNGSLSLRSDFKDKPYLNRIISHSNIPPTFYYKFENGHFSNSQYINIEVFIPYGTLSSYKGANVWKNFLRIKELDPILAKEVTLNETSISLKINETFQLSATVSPEDTSDKTVVWTSKDETIASVSSNGLITANSIGNTQIVASCGEISTICEVTVTPILAEGLKLNKNSISLTKGTDFQLVATIDPEDTTNKTIIWESNNEKVATVSDDGLVSAIEVGNAKITASCGDVFAICEVVVTDIDGVGYIINEDEQINVYTVNGVLIKEGIRVKELDNLDPGIYIIQTPKRSFKIQK